MDDSRVTPGMEAMGGHIVTRRVRIYDRPYAINQPQRSAEYSYRANYEPRRGKLARIDPENPPALTAVPQRVAARAQPQPALGTTHAPSKKKPGPILLLGVPGAMVIISALFSLALAWSPNKKPATPVHVKSASVASNEARATPQRPLVVAANRGLPTLLEIPKLKVDAQISYLGLTQNGSMAVPTNITNVGWYKYGALPGNAGNAVIVGHLDGSKGQPGVFSNLNKLQPGDDILVIDAKNQTTTFVVRALQIYAQSEKPSNIFASTGASHLNLITCTGGWDAAQHRYLQRLVVLADKV